MYIDEPDVHVHPDMQARLGQLIANIAERTSIQFIIATHSTSFLAGLSQHAGIHVAFMAKHQSNLAFESAS